MSDSPKKARRSTSEGSIGAKMSRAKDFVTVANAFTPAYVTPTPALSLISLGALIDTAVEAASAYTVARSKWFVATTERRRLFGSRDGGLKHRLSGIGSAVLAAFSKSSVEYASVMAIIRKVRGHVKKGSGGAGVSQSEQSFAATTTALADIITLIGSFGPAYNPANAVITGAGLAALHAAIVAANASVATTAVAAGEALETRNNAIASLAEHLQRAKAAIVSQYGPRSVEAGSVRKLVR